jgi:hypothetical protein
MPPTSICQFQLYSTAVDALIEKYRYSGVTEQLDAVYEADPEASRLGHDVEELQARSLTTEDRMMASV